MEEEEDQEQQERTENLGIWASFTDCLACRVTMSEESIVKLFKVLTAIATLGTIAATSCFVYFANTIGLDTMEGHASMGSLLTAIIILPLVTCVAVSKTCRSICIKRSRHEPEADMEMVELNVAAHHPFLPNGGHTVPERVRIPIRQLLAPEPEEEPPVLEEGFQLFPNAFNRRANMHRLIHNAVQA